MHASCTRSSLVDSKIKLCALPKAAWLELGLKYPANPANTFVRYTESLNKNLVKYLEVKLFVT